MSDAMINPSVYKLKKITGDRYSLVVITSKRAREIIDGDEPLVNIKSNKALTIAINEVNEGKIELTKTANKVSSRFDKTNLKEGRFADVTLNVKANSYKNQDTVYSKLDIVLVLDSSGSMSYGPNGENDSTTPNRIESAKTAGKQFINH